MTTTGSERGPRHLPPSAQPDADLHGQIRDLAHEEHRLLQAHTSGGLQPDERDRLHAVERALDAAWDLLRLRQARRDAGLSASQLPA